MKKLDELIGQSEHFLDLLEMVSKLAPINRPVLILGERGTGKELIAKRLHFLSARWDKPLVNLNCASLSKDLIDSELFGHEAGSFSGAKAQHKGRFERAEGGSLFLDELATSPISVQEKLLRVIEYGEYERVGGSRTLNANVRLICATNEDLLIKVEKGEFRADLLDRLAFEVLHIPPLRERKEDILLLAEHYAIKMCQELGYRVFSGFSDNTKELLLDYSWPGNVRELKNVVERAIYRLKDESYPIENLQLDPFTCTWQKNTYKKSEKQNNTFTFPFDLRQWQHDQEKEIIQQALSQAKHNQQNAAKLLGLSYYQLRGALRKFQLVGENKEDDK